MFQKIGKTLEMFCPLPLAPIEAQPFVIFRNADNGLTSVVSQKELEQLSKPN